MLYSHRGEWPLLRQARKRTGDRRLIAAPEWTIALTCTSLCREDSYKQI
jgi:hypothetical protein